MTPLLSQVGKESPYDKGSIITVTGTRKKGLLKDSAITTEVITRKEIDEMGARDLSDTLGNVPGIEVRPAQSGERGETVRLQGLSSQNVLILVDGQRTTGRFNGSIDLTRFKADDIERIEIVKGASSAIYGSDAIAGVINIITKEAKDPFSAEFRTQGGTGSNLYYGPYQEFRNYASVGTKGEKIGTLFTVGWHKGEGYDLTRDATEGPRNGKIPSLATSYNPYPKGMGPLTTFLVGTRFPEYTPPLESTSGSSFQDMNLTNKTTFQISNTALITTNLYYRLLNQSAVDSSPPRTTFDRTNKTYDTMGSINLDWSITNKVQFNLNTNHSRFQDVFQTDQRKSDELDTKQTTNNGISEVRTRIDYKFSDTHVTSMGMESLQDTISSSRIAPDCKRNYPSICPEDLDPSIGKGQTINGNAERTRNAIFLQDEWRISDKPKIQIVPGIRFDNDSIYGGEWLPKLAVRYDLNDKVRFRAANGLGYRAPSFQDLYFNFLNPGVGYRITGNENLKPELSRSYNLGMEWDINRSLWFSINFFHNNIDNLIGFRTNPIRDASGLMIYQTSNYQKAQTEGIESSLQYRVNSNLSLGLGYTLTETEDKLTNLPLEGRGRNRWNTNLRYEEKKTGLIFSLFAVVFGKQPFYCIQNLLGCSPEFSPELSGITSEINSESQTLSQQFLKDIPQAISDYCTERNLSFCTTNPTYNYKLVNPHTNLNLRISQKLNSHFQWFLGVENLLDAWEVQYNPQRPRFFYIGLDGRLNLE